MKTFLMFLKMESRRVVVFGGEEDAAQKSWLMLKIDAEICILADDLNAELAAQG